MRIPVESYGNALILHAILFRYQGINNRFMPKSAASNYLKMLNLSQYNLETLEIVDRDDSCGLNDLALMYVQEDLRMMAERVNAEAKSESGLNGTVLRLVRIVNTTQHRGLVYSDFGKGSFPMQLRNLLLINQIELRADGFWPNETNVLRVSLQPTVGDGRVLQLKCRVWKSLWSVRCHFPRAEHDLSRLRVMRTVTSAFRVA